MPAVVNRSPITAAVAIIVLLTTASSAATAADELYFVGTGDTIVGVDVGQVESETSNYPMSPDGHGGEATEFISHGSWNVDSDENTFVPTFIYEGEAGPITLTGAGPLIALTHFDHRLGDFCPVMGQIFDGEGNVLGPDGGVELRIGSPGPDVVQGEFEFEGIAGEFAGLKVQFAPFGTDCGTPGVEFHWGSDDHPGRLILGPGDYVGEPPAGDTSDSGPTLHHINLTGEVANVRHAFNGTNDTYRLNWTTEDDTLNLTHAVNVTAGSAMVRLTDGANVTVFEQEFTENASEEVRLEDTTSGNWSIEIQYTDFTGVVDLEIFAVEAGAGPDGSDQGGDDGDPGGDDGDAGADDGSTGNATGDDADEESPGFTFAAIGAALFAAVVVMRRRRT